MHIAYFITGHGFGHGIRSVAVCNALDPAIRLTIRSSLPERFFTEEMRRPFDYLYGEFDCGCIQRDGITVDAEATVRAYAAIAEVNRTQLESQVRWCREQGVDGIVSDIVPFAFQVAHAAGIPSVAVSNFSWYDIYRDYLPENPWFAPVLDEIGRQYALADLLVAMEPATGLGQFSRRCAVGPVGQRAAACRAQLCDHYGIDAAQRIALIYVGNYGLDNVPWSRLAGYPGWEFFGIHPLAGAPANYHLFTKTGFSYQQLSASVDLLIAKLGYGVYAECLLNGLPLIYLPRSQFAEFPLLHEAVRQWGAGWCLSLEDFCACRWDAALAAIGSRPRPQPGAADGAAQAASLVCRGLYNSLESLSAQ